MKKKFSYCLCAVLVCMLVSVTFAEHRGSVVSPDPAVLSTTCPEPETIQTTHETEIQETETKAETKSGETYTQKVHYTPKAKEPKISREKIEKATEETTEEESATEESSEFECESSENSKENSNEDSLDLAAAMSWNETSEDDDVWYDIPTELCEHKYERFGYDVSEGMDEWICCRCGDWYYTAPETEESEECYIEMETAEPEEESEEESEEYFGEMETAEPEEETE